MPIPPLDTNGRLPLGRYLATTDEIHAEFVNGQAPKRQQVWDDFLELTTALQEIVTVPAAWLSGSLLSSKPDPGDVDVVYLIEWTALAVARMDSRAAQFLDIVGRKLAKDVLNLSVDSFILEWTPTPGPNRHVFPQYLEDRGYWDDLWSRERDGDDRLDSIPRRGYLEVILDGFS